jgi:hypothetical protein
VLGRQHEALQQVGADESDLLRDEAPDREAEQVDPLKLHRLEEGDRVVRHCFDGPRRRAGRGSDADVVERDHSSIRSERVDERGVPVVEVAAEVLQEDQWHLTFAEVAVRVLDRVVGRDSPSRSVGVSHWYFGPRLFGCGCHLLVLSRSRVSGRLRRRPTLPPFR